MNSHTLCISRLLALLTLALAAFAPAFASVPKPISIPHSPREAPTLEEFFAEAREVRLDQRRHVAGITPWNHSDLRAVIRIVYDEVGLWVRVEATDDHYHPPLAPALALGDSLGVAFSLGGKTVDHGFLYARTAAGPEARRTHGRGGPGALDTQLHGARLYYDVRLPWPSLAPVQPRAGQRFRMNLWLNENDGGGHRGRLEMAPGADREPAKWPEWVLQ